MLRLLARRATALAAAASPRATRHAMPLFPSPRPMLPSSWRSCSSDGSGGSSGGGSSGGTAAEAFVPLFSRNGYKPTDRTQRRVATTVRESLVHTLASGIIKDRRMEDGAAVNVLDVQVAKGSMVARVLWEPMTERHDADRIHSALQKKSGILRHHVNSYLNHKRAIALEFVRADKLPQRAQTSPAASALFDAVRADLAAADTRRQQQQQQAEHEDVESEKER